MYLSWDARKTRLSVLLKSNGDENEDGLALDRIIHGQTVIGKTAKTAEIDSLRFKDQDLDVLGTLEFGQFGVIDVVKCCLDGRVYARKSTEKRFALRTREQCFPQIERDILLRAAETRSEWAPHLLCAFQTTTHVNLVMDYAEGGTLWDVLESSPHDGKVSEADLKWWIPQLVSAVHWCHLQGFVHRDIKPHNFVLSPTSHVLLIDFGSAAPLLPPQRDGSQQVPKRHCLVPCGTCDYISPEILQAHEAAIVALDVSDEGRDDVNEGYGRETDWWSLGAMLYEMAYGVAPFFANDIRQTYLRIMNHKSSLRLGKATVLSAEFQDLIRRLLADCEQRLGRRNVEEITNHPFFQGVSWPTLRQLTAPSSLHLPQFIYSVPTGPGSRAAPAAERTSSEPASPAFAFSALFQSSKDSASAHGISLQPTTPGRSMNQSAVSDASASAFMGFSWGPRLDAFPPTPGSAPIVQDTPRPLRALSLHTTPNPLLAPPTAQADPPYVTPTRPTNLSLRIPASTIRRTPAPRRNVTDREAMKLLVDCVGMSARKKVLESGRKPRATAVPSSQSRSAGGSGSLRKKELRFLSSFELTGNRGASGSGRAKDGENRDPMVMSSGSEDESEGPPSPSPINRPGSGMSRRSYTPTISGSQSRLGAGISSNTPVQPVAVTLPAPVPPSIPLNQLSNTPSRHPSAEERIPVSELELEEKHRVLMSDIEGIERRLCHLLVRLGGDE